MNRRILTLLPVLLGLVLLLGCSSDDNPIGGEEVDTDYNLEGTWDAETETGRLFVMRILSQNGAALAGDISADGSKVGLAGRINGDTVEIQANFQPTIFFDADLTLDSSQMVNGLISDANGTSADRFAAIKR